MRFSNRKNFSSSFSTLRRVAVILTLVTAFGPIAFPASGASLDTDWAVHGWLSLADGFDPEKSEIAANDCFTSDIVPPADGASFHYDADYASSFRSLISQTNTSVDAWAKASWVSGSIKGSFNRMKSASKRMSSREITYVMSWRMDFLPAKATNVGLSQRGEELEGLHQNHPDRFYEKCGGQFVRELQTYATANAIVSIRIKTLSTVDEVKQSLKIAVDHGPGSIGFDQEKYDKAVKELNSQEVEVHYVLMGGDPDTLDDFVAVEDLHQIKALLRNHADSIEWDKAVLGNITLKNTSDVTNLPPPEQLAFLNNDVELGELLDAYWQADRDHGRAVNIRLDADLWGAAVSSLDHARFRQIAEDLDQYRRDAKEAGIECLTAIVGECPPVPQRPLGLTSIAWPSLEPMRFECKSWIGNDPSYTRLYPPNGYHGNQVKMETTIQVLNRTPQQMTRRDGAEPVVWLRDGEPLCDSKTSCTVVPDNGGQRARYDVATPAGDWWAREFGQNHSMVFTDFTGERREITVGKFKFETPDKHQAAGYGNCHCLYEYDCKGYEPPNDPGPVWPPPAGPCLDGYDNDGDGLADYPDDPGCSSRDDDSEEGEQPAPALEISFDRLEVVGTCDRNQGPGEFSWRMSAGGEVLSEIPAVQSTRLTAGAKVPVDSMILDVPASDSGPIVLSVKVDELDGNVTKPCQGDRPSSVWPIGEDTVTFVRQGSNWLNADTGGLAASGSLTVRNDQKGEHCEVEVDYTINLVH